MAKYKINIESKYEDAIGRMNAILEVLEKGKEHRPDIIRKVIEIGEYALKDGDGE